MFLGRWIFTTESQLIRLWFSQAFMGLLVLDRENKPAQELRGAVSGQAMGLIFTVIWDVELGL